MLVLKNVDLFGCFEFQMKSFGGGHFLVNR